MGGRIFEGAAVFDGGINFVDMACCYGDGVELIGRTVSGPEQARHT
jgi:aryl-alcohol dehydrogenase-like predicted oxidoreductase